MLLFNEKKVATEEKIRKSGEALYDETYEVFWQLSKDTKKDNLTRDEQNFMQKIDNIITKVNVEKQLSDFGYDYDKDSCFNDIYVWATHFKTNSIIKHEKISKFVDAIAEVVIVSGGQQATNYMYKEDSIKNSVIEQVPHKAVGGCNLL